ncbi:MAG: hypothetical protein M0Q42_00595 [Xanthomonadales bacterium]|nr:hypothetical protein [Xanthomonadales bacterium]
MAKPWSKMSVPAAAAVVIGMVLAGCATTARLTLDHDNAPVQYHGPPLDRLRTALPPGWPIRDDSVSSLLQAFEEFHGIDRGTILEAAFHRHFHDDLRRLPPGAHWLLKLEMIGLAMPDIRADLMQPVFLVTLRLDDADGRDLWHGRESVAPGHPSTPAFDLEQLAADPGWLSAAWQAAADETLSRLQRKYRAGERDRREGYAR